MFTELTKQSFGTHSALKTVENYISQSPTLRCIVPDVINPDDFKRLFWSEVAGRTTEDRELLVGFTCLKNEYGVLSRIIETKLVFNLDATVGVLNRENYLVLAMCARSIMEHAASLIYLRHQTAKILAGFRDSKSLQDLSGRINSLRDFFGKFMYGTKFFGDDNKKKLGLNNAIHINDMLKCGDTQAPGMRRNYDFLCDLVHPNFLSNAIVFCPDTDGWSLEQDEEFQRNVTVLILNTIEGTLRYLDSHTTELFWTFLHDCDHYFRKFMQPGILLEGLFEEAPFAFTGDGLSKVTAIQFSAISMRDHFRMLEKLIVDRRLGGPGTPVASEEAGGFNFSCLEFPMYKLWFKISKELEFHRKSVLR